MTNPLRFKILTWHFFAGFMISRSMPDSFHGSLHGSFSRTLTESGDSFREFMSEWEVASFLGLLHEEFESLIETGELRGTYTGFQVERNVWRPLQPAPEAQVGSGGVAAAPQRIENDTVIVDQRVFSREKLTEWLLGRMDAPQ